MACWSIFFVVSRAWDIEKVLSILKRRIIKKGDPWGIEPETFGVRVLMIFHFNDGAQFPGRVIPLLVSYSGYSLLYLSSNHSNLLCHQGFSHKCSDLGLQETNFAENVFKLSSPSAPSLPSSARGWGRGKAEHYPFPQKGNWGEGKNNCLWWVDGPVGSWTEPKLNSEIMRLIRTICLLRSRLLSATQRCPAGGVALRDILKNGSKVRLMLR